MNKFCSIFLRKYAEDIGRKLYDSNFQTTLWPNEITTDEYFNITPVKVGVNKLILALRETANIKKKKVYNKDDI